MLKEVIMLAVITGASSGIGQELAIQLAKQGYDLFIIARREDRLKYTKNILSNTSKVNVEILSLDLSNLKNCEELISILEKKKIDIFINNAGFGVYGDSTKTDINKEMDMIDLNIKTLHYLTKSILKLMSEGKIVNISSMAAFLPTPLLSSYAATKSYVYSYSMALRYELQKNKKPIDVITVCPGPVITEFNLIANASPKMKGLPVSKCVKSIISGIKKNKALNIPGLKMKMMYHLLKLTPRKLKTSISYSIQSKK